MNKVEEARENVHCHCDSCIVYADAYALAVLDAALSAAMEGFQPRPLISRPWETVWENEPLLELRKRIEELGK